MKYILACLFFFINFANTLFGQSVADSAAIAWRVKSSIFEADKKEGFLPVFPKEAKLHGIDIKDNNLDILLQIDPIFLRKKYTDEQNEMLTERVLHALENYTFEAINIKAKDEKGKWLSLSQFYTEPLPPLDVPTAFSFGELRPKAAVEFPNKAQPNGMLNGKTVWLSPGHGWYHNLRYKTFLTQRDNNYGVVEDFASIEAVNYYLLKYLYNAGANVWSVRERDMNENEVIVDNETGSPAYTEIGQWATGTGKGYLGKGYRYAWTKNKESARAIFQPNVPEAGMYWVSVRYFPSKNRATDARIKIQHAGGESVVSIDQQTHGDTWVYLGQFYFEKGTSGKIIFSNESSESDKAIIADAVRLGGGRSTQPDCESGAKNNVPKYEEAARHYAYFQGFDNCKKNDVTVRPSYAEWELAKGSDWDKANAIYFAWHTNAGGGGGKGTESFVHTYRSTWKARQLRDFVHDQLVADIRAGWDPKWIDRRRSAADLGELRELQTMPGVLFEIAFHDNEAEAEALTTPKFREIAARAAYKGIVRYFANKDGKEPVFLPERPTHLEAYNNGDGNITLKWQTPPSGGIYGDAPRRYKIYVSEHGKGFSASAIISDSTSYTLTNLQYNKNYYFRVTATNTGGESFSTPVVAARTPKKGETATFLLVDGFDRLDRSMAVMVNEPKPSSDPLGETRRLFLDKMNNYDYSVEHAQSLGALDIAFDGTSNEAVADGKISLKKYKTLNWFLGNEATNDKTLDAKEQQQLAQFLNGGGNLVISGSELAYHLDAKAGGKDFYQKYLKAKYAGDNAGTSAFIGKSGTIFNGIKDNFNKKGYGAYQVKYPDFLQAEGDAKVLLQYENGKIAGVGYKGKFGIVNIAFPLEMVASDAVRNDLFKKIITFLDAFPKTNTATKN